MAERAPAWATPRVAWFTMAMIGLVTVFGQMDRVIFTALVTPIKRDLGLSDVQMGVLMGFAYAIPYFLCGIPIARLTDVGRRTLILPGALLLWSLGTAMCALAGSYNSLFAARTMVGAGESVKGPASVSMISDLFPRAKLSRAFSVYNFCIQGGDAFGQIMIGLLLGVFAALGTLYLPILGEMHGWHLVFLSFGLPGIALAIVFALTVREPARHGRTRNGSMPLREVGQFLFHSRSGKVLVPILLASAILQIEGVGIGSWRAAFYERSYGWTPAQFLPIVGTGNLIITPIGLALGAWLTERMVRAGRSDAHMRIVLWAHILGLPLGIVGPLMPSFELAYACSLTGLLLTIGAAPAQLAAMQIVTPNELRAQVNALYMFTVGVLGQGAGPWVIALITQHLFKSEGSLRYAMVSAVAVAVPVAIVLIWRTLKPYGEAFRAANAADGE